MTSSSDDYHDYVFRDGRLVGDFDGMYRHSAEVPWNQDASRAAVFSEITLAIFRQHRWRSICDTGCGLGYFTDRCRAELESPGGGRPAVTGVEIAPSAVGKARSLFPGVRFLEGDMLATAPPLNETFDLVFAKDILWYVCQEMDRFLANMAALGRGGRLYLGNSFPESKTWIGQDVIARPEDIRDRLATVADIEYFCVEYDNRYHGRPYAHALGRTKPIADCGLRIAD